MEALQNKARELLAAKTVQVVIGYGRGSAGAARAVFVRDPRQADGLIFDDTCRQNLAVYLHEARSAQAGQGGAGRHAGRPAHHPAAGGGEPARRP